MRSGGSWGRCRFLHPSMLSCSCPNALCSSRVKGRGSLSLFDNLRDVAVQRGQWADPAFCRLRLWAGCSMRQPEASASGSRLATSSCCLPATGGVNHRAAATKRPRLLPSSSAPGLERKKGLEQEREVGDSMTLSHLRSKGAGVWNQQLAGPSQLPARLGQTSGLSDDAAHG